MPKEIIMLFRTAKVTQILSLPDLSFFDTLKFKGPQLICLCMAMISFHFIPTQASGETKTLSFENGVCLSVALDDPDLIDTRTARRFSLNAPRSIFLEAVTLKLNLPSATEPVSLLVFSAHKTSPSDGSGYLSQCSFTEGPAGFVRQVPGSGGCTVVGSGVEAYHSRPGSRDNVSVQCRPELPGRCQSMVLFEQIGPVRAHLHATIRNSDPATWLPLADEIRAFVQRRITHLPDC